MKNDYEIRGEQTAIFLSSPKYGDMEALIDTPDLSKAQSIDLTWCVRKHRNSFYAFCNMWIDGKKITVKLHRFLMDSPDCAIDHINHNGLDNRRSVNLRKATSGQNQQNRRGAQRGSKTGVRGVTWSALRNEFVVEVCVNGKRRHRYCKTLEEAKSKAIELRTKYMPYSNEALAK